MCTMFEWLRADAVRASRIKRLRFSALHVTLSNKILSATTRFSRVSRALYTSPMPPVPCTERISYGPRRAPTAKLMLSTSGGFGLAVCGEGSKHERECSDLELVSISKADRRCDHAPLDVRTVLASQILQNHSTAVHDDPGVLAGNSW